MNVLRLGGYQGPDSILTSSLQQIAAKLRRAPADWLVTCEADVTAKGESARSLFTSIECGVRHLGYMASGYLVAQVPELALLDTPFAVHDRKQALSTLDAETGQWLAQCIERRTGYKLLGWWDNGFRHLSNRKHPIYSAADCHGLRIRTLDSAVYRQSLTALGFSPISIDVKDFPAALKAGSVDAQENPLANYALFSVGQYHQYLSLTSHFFGVLLLVCNRAWFESLDNADQQELISASQAATLRQRQLAEAEDTLVRNGLVDRGIQLVEPEHLDLASMIEATESVRHTLKQQLPAERVEAYVQDAALLA
jgi:TRAP-type transport system periplasmic protein